MDCTICFLYMHRTDTSVIYVIIHFSNSVGFFVSGFKFVQGFLTFVYTCVVYIIKKGDYDHINLFNSAIFVSLLQPGPGFPTVHFVYRIYIQLFWVRGYCSFCCYW